MSMSIGGLAQYLYGPQNTSQTPLTPLSLLGSSGSNGSSSGSSQSSGSGVPSSYTFPTDTAGRPLVATMTDMTAASSPKDKLIIASQIAEAIRMQTDCAVQTGRADRIADMTKQTTTLMDAATSVVGSIATTDGSVADGQSDPAVTPYKSSITTMLGRISSVMANLKILTSKTSSDLSSQTSATLATLSAQASKLATQAGLDWSTISKAGSAGATTATTAPRLLDYLV